jgi:hypothetical protein
MHAYLLCVVECRIGSVVKLCGGGLVIAPFVHKAEGTENGLLSTSVYSLYCSYSDAKSRSPSSTYLVYLKNIVDLRISI